MSQIEFKDVNKVYPNGHVGLKDINLNIEKGDFAVIVGLSGAGKSTLLRSVNRLHDITSGDILIEGKSITKAKGNDLLMMRRNIGMIFQHFNLVKRSSVLRNVLSGRVGYHPTWKMVLGLFPKEDKVKAMDALERVNILDKYDQRSDELSGGQQQRISIARALAQEPAIILADEPVASLDPLTTKQVMDDLKKINEELGITILINLHFVDLALEYGTRIIGLRAGELVFDGPASEATEEVFNDIYGRKLKDDEKLGLNNMTTPTTSKYDEYLNKKFSLKTSFTIFLVLALIIWSFLYTGFSFADLMVGLPQIGSFFGQMVPPDWAYIHTILKPMLDTIRMAIVGTFLGAIVSIPIALICASNIVKTKWISIPARFILNIVRTIPDLLLAAIFVAVFGIGQIPGVLALFILTICVIAKLLYEALETIDPGPMEAMTAVGANKTKWIVFGVVPQILSTFFSYVLFAFEINIRASAVLGLVGAGGIGLFYDSTLGLFQYPKTAMIILFTLVIVVIIDYVSSKVREQLA